MTWLLHQAPSLCLCLWGFLTHWLTGNKKRVGWALGVLGQAGWFTFALWLHQYGLFIGCFVYGAVYVRNWLKWKTP